MQAHVPTDSATAAVGSAGPDTLEHALGYLAAGLPVFAVCSPLFGAHTHARKVNDKWVEELCPKDEWGKIPLVSWGKYRHSRRVWGAGTEVAARELP